MDINVDYVERLRSQLPIPELEFVLPRSPTSTLLNIEKSDTNLSLLQLNELAHCKLAQIVAEHNTTLGKVATHANRFIYNIEFLKHVDTCIIGTENEQLKALLNRAKSEKIAAIPKYWQNLLAGSSEITTIWTISRFPLAIDVNQGEQDTLNALNQLANVSHSIKQNQFSEINSETVTDSLEKLNNNPYLSSLFTAIKQQIGYTKLITEQLYKHDLDKICETGKSNQAGKILTNIFSKYYAKQLQPYHNQLLTKYQRVRAHLVTIYSHKINNAAINSNLINEIETYADLKAVSLTHVIWWQKLYKKCVITPG